jgi:hypothetical protein
MVDVFLDKRLDDYFTSHDWTEIEGSSSARDAVLNDFVSEKIATIHGLNTGEIDFAFLETVRFPQMWKMKKFRFKDLLDQVEQAKETAELYSFVLKDVFGGDEGRFRYFAGQLSRVEQIADGLINRLLGGLDVETKIMVTRFSETRMENLHYDMDPGSDDHEAFRLYINLDAYPRIWSTSYQLTTLLRKGGRRLVEGIDPNSPAETILKRAVGRAFGGWNQRATERLAPRHQIYFDPGDIWIVDGRSVSHQVLSGYRVLSVYVKLPHAGNAGLRPTFAEKIRGALADGMEVPVGQETALVNYFNGSEITAAPNLQENWADVFGNVRTGRIRRFDDAGMSVS